MKNESNNERLGKDNGSNLEENFASLSRSCFNISGENTLTKIKQDIIAQQIPALKNFANGLGTCALSVFDIEEFFSLR